MLRLLTVVLACVAITYGKSAIDQCSKDSLMKALQSAQISSRYNETVAHAIHAFTMNDLIKFNTNVKDSNGIPVVNPRLNDPTTTERVLRNAPWETPGSGWSGETMGLIDMILSNIGQPTDGLGPNWSPLERVVHKFHMRDLWAELKPFYDSKLEIFKRESMEKDSCTQAVCDLLTDVDSTGIFEAVDWVARHYKTGTPITLLNRPIPKLKDAKSWQVWKERLLHYYDVDGLSDASTYLACALNRFDN